MSKPAITELAEQVYTIIQPYSTGTTSYSDVCTRLTGRWANLEPDSPLLAEALGLIVHRCRNAEPPLPHSLLSSSIKAQTRCLATATSLLRIRASMIRSSDRLHGHGSSPTSTSRRIRKRSTSCRRPPSHKSLAYSRHSELPVHGRREALKLWSPRHDTADCGVPKDGRMGTEDRL